MAPNLQNKSAPVRAIIRFVAWIFLIGCILIGIYFVFSAFNALRLPSSDFARSVLGLNLLFGVGAITIGLITWAVCNWFVLMLEVTLSTLSAVEGLAPELQRATRTITSAITVKPVSTNEPAPQTAVGAPVMDRTLRAERPMQSTLLPPLKADSPRTCPNCGRVNHSTARECDRCGNSFVSGPYGV
jgi:hypothetical protein